MQIDRLTPALGAEVALDLSGATESMVDDIHAALIEHQVLFFRDQNLSPDDHVRLGKLFGDLDIPHPVYQNHKQEPAITVLENDGNRPPDTNDWHKDLTFRPDPPFLSILYALTVPETGGDTLWASMSAAYETLPAEMKQMLENRHAVHDIGTFRNDYLGADLNLDAMNQGLVDNGSAVHPVIGTHPVTGQRYLNVNRSFTVHIVGMLKAESDHLLGYLYAHADRPENQVRFRWKDGSVAMWDNRITQHYALADYLPGYRHMNRVTVTSDRRAGSSP